MPKRASKVPDSDSEDDQFVEDMIIHVLHIANSSDRSIRKTVTFILEHREYSLLIARSWAKQVLETKRNAQKIVLFRILDGVYQKCAEEPSTSIMWSFDLIIYYVLENLLTDCKNVTLLKHIENMLIVWATKSIYNPTKLENYKKRIGDLANTLEESLSEDCDA